jgi:phosphoribosyl 1,2-cyclic phosphodiesterase
VQVTLDNGPLVVLDAGTGIRLLGQSVQAAPPPEIHILLTHLHLDHLVGLGFFAPLFIPGVDVHLWGPRSPLHSLEERILRYMSPPLFPVHLSQVGSVLTLHDVPDEPWTIGSATVTAANITHNGPALGYRFEEGGRALAYMPDHEPGLGIDLRLLEAEWLSGYAVARDADILIHDSQYTSSEYLDRVGWGHSSIEQVVTFAQRAGVAKLVLFHHDPLHADVDLQVMERDAQRLWGPFGERPELAYEGMTLDVTRAAKTA